MSDVDSSTQERAVTPVGLAVDLLRFEKGFLHIVSEKPFPPGSPLTMTWREQEISGRSIGAKKNAEGRFAVSLRMVNLTRAQLDLLAKHL